jgi:hypothetical protein
MPIRLFYSIALTCISFTSASISFAQVFVIDTVDSPGGRVLLYSNYRWEYLHDRNFSGIMSQHLQSLLDADTTFNLINYWDTEICYSAEARAFNYDQINDTIWLCAVDSIHKHFVMPIRNLVTSRYGWRKGRMHYGIDLNCNTGDTILASFSGRVRYAKFNDGGYGNLVVIRHYNGLETYYAHLSKILVYPNQLVQAGEVIGLGGNTGRSYGAHLHYEVRFYDLPIDPELLIDFEKGELVDENIFIHKGLFRPFPQLLTGDMVASFGSKASAAPRNDIGAKYHKIRKGDTLSAIAKRHNTSIVKLCKLNGIKESTILKEGRTIRVR